jgi:hypothetical protein
MVHSLTCPTCSGVFEIPPEYAASPMIQCPFCGGMAPNAAARVPVSQRRITVSSLTPINALAETDVHQATPKPTFEVSGGLSAGAVRKLDPSTRKRRKRPDEVDDDELVPEADPTEALPPAALPAAFSSDVSYPYGLDGSPLTYGLPPSPSHQAPVQASVAAVPTVPLGGGVARRPQPSAPPPAPAVDLPDIDIDDDMPKPQSRVTITLLILLLLVNAFVLLTATLNNGIFNTSDIGGTFAAAYGSGQAMELKRGAVVAPPPAADGLLPLGDDDDRADLRWMLSAPTLLKLTNGDLVFVVYGQAVNRDPSAFDEVIVEGVLHDAQGATLAKSLASPLIPLFSHEVSPKGLAARDALKSIAAVYSRETLPEAWPKRAMEDLDALKLAQGATAGFVLVFKDISKMPADLAMVEVSIQRARRAPGGRP